MAKTFKKIEIVGTSDQSYAEATRAAIGEAAKTVQNISWFEVVQQSGSVEDGMVKEFQVTLKIGFRIER